MVFQHEYYNIEYRFHPKSLAAFILILVDFTCRTNPLLYNCQSELLDK